MAWLFEDLLDSVDDGIKLIQKGLKTYSEFQKLVNDSPIGPSGSREESVIAGTDDIKSTDETKGEKPIQPSRSCPSNESFVEMEKSSDGVYRAVRPKLEEK
jgi:hypothetical protein